MSIRAGTIRIPRQRTPRVKDVRLSWGGLKQRVRSGAMQDLPVRGNSSSLEWGHGAAWASGSVQAPTADLKKLKDLADSLFPPSAVLSVELSSFVDPFVGVSRMHWRLKVGGLSREEFRSAKALFLDSLDTVADAIGNFIISVRRADV